MRRFLFPPSYQWSSAGAEAAGCGASGFRTALACFFGRARGFFFNGIMIKSSYERKRSKQGHFVLVSGRRIEIGSAD
jgi:hypothetical protein